MVGHSTRLQLLPKNLLRAEQLDRVYTALLLDLLQ